jgi:hypothetical protein
MLTNISIIDLFKKWCDCHTCFIKLPVVTVIIVLTNIYFIK